MHETTAREKILKRIRNAGLVGVENLYSEVNLDANVYVGNYDDDLLIVFAEELNKIDGSFVYCENSEEFAESFTALVNTLKIKSVYTRDKKILALLNAFGMDVDTEEDKLTASQMTVTGCEAIVARTGSVVISSAQESGRAANFIPDVHVVIAGASQIVATVKDVMNFLSEKYGELPSMISFITGPSRTADIEKTLVMGAHGPRKLIVFVIENYNYE